MAQKTLQTLRVARGLTASEAAKRAGLTDHCHLRRLERGLAVPQERTLQRLALAYGVSIETVFKASRNTRALT